MTVHLRSLVFKVLRETFGHVARAIRKTNISSFGCPDFVGALYEFKHRPVRIVVLFKLVLKYLARVY